MSKTRSIKVIILNKGRILALKGGCPTLRKKNPEILRSKFDFVKRISSRSLVDYYFCMGYKNLVPNSLFYGTSFSWESIDDTDCKDIISDYLSKPKVIIVTGTPGAGKSTFASKLSLLIRGTYVDVNKVIKKHRLGGDLDEERNTALIEVKTLNKHLLELIKSTKKHLIIDSHLSHYLPSRRVDLCIVLECSDLKILKKRLLKRGYNALKTSENLDSEAFKVCKIDALESGHNVISVNSAVKSDINAVLRLLSPIL